MIGCVQLPIPFSGRNGSERGLASGITGGRDVAGTPAYGAPVDRIGTPNFLEFSSACSTCLRGRKYGMDMPIPERAAEQHYDRRIGLRMPVLLYAAIERRAREHGLPLSTVVRAALQHEVEAR